MMAALEPDLGSDLRRRDEQEAVAEGSHYLQPEQDRRAGGLLGRAETQASPASDRDVAGAGELPGVDTLRGRAPARRGRARGALGHVDAHVGAHVRGAAPDEEVGSEAPLGHALRAQDVRSTRFDVDGSERLAVTGTGAPRVRVEHVPRAKTHEDVVVDRVVEAQHQADAARREATLDLVVLAELDRGVLRSAGRRAVGVVAAVGVDAVPAVVDGLGVVGRIRRAARVQLAHVVGGAEEGEVPRAEDADPDPAELRLATGGALLGGRALVVLALAARALVVVLAVLALALGRDPAGRARLRAAREVRRALAGLGALGRGGLAGQVRRLAGDRLLDRDLVRVVAVARRRYGVIRGVEALKVVLQVAELDVRARDGAAPAVAHLRQIDGLELRHPEALVLDHDLRELLRAAVLRVDGHRRAHGLLGHGGVGEVAAGLRPTGRRRGAAARSPGCPLLRLGEERFELLRLEVRVELQRGVDLQP